MKEAKVSRAICGAAVLITGAVACLMRAEAPIPWGRVTKEMLCITEGDITDKAGGVLAVDVPKMRAYVNGDTSPEAEVRFTYLGATGKDVPLGSGEMRRQFGLKLLAADACNLLYVMWRIEPESKVVVSLKSNPGQHTSAECGNRGYRNIKAGRASRVPVVQAGATHTMKGSLKGEELEVFIDGGLIWEGTVDQDASRLKGPVGVRSDNARLEFMLQVPVGANRGAAPGCRKEEGE